MTRERKPIPKNQSEIVQDTITPYLNQGKPVSQNVFTHRDNRALNTTRKTDNIKDISVGLEDIDYAIKYYFETVIQPIITQDGTRIKIPIMYGSPERWQSVQAEGYYRDTNGKAIFPLIMFKRNNIEKNRNLGNKIDGNLAALFQVFESRYNQRNQYDKFSILTNRIPSKQYYVSVVPDYVTITYDVSILTNYVEQNNKIIESIGFAADSYWGDPSRWQFRTSIDSFATTNVINTGEDRIASTTLTLKVNGYLVPNVINQHLADANIHYSPSRIIFTLETSDSSELFSATSKATPAPKSAMGATSVADSYNVNVTNVTNTTIDTSVLTYLNTNKNVIGTFASSTTNPTTGKQATATITFANSWLTAPTGLPATSKDNFTFFINGVYVEPNSIISFTQAGGISTLILNTDETVTGNLGYPVDSTDLTMAIGKFA